MMTSSSESVTRLASQARTGGGEDVRHQAAQRRAAVDVGECDRLLNHSLDARIGDSTCDRTGGFAAIIATFFGLGLLLSFTPCMLPMVPILSGLIAGQGSKVTTGRAFSLSLTYVLGMALTYTIAGAAFAAAGKQVQAVFQQPWIILLFAALLLADELHDANSARAASPSEPPPTPEQIAPAMALRLDELATTLENLASRLEG
mgnify:CR=1 FL=1